MDFYTDIETVRRYKEWADVPPRLQELFEKRYYSDYYRGENPDVSIEQRWNEQAGLTSEFGKIVALALTWYKSEDNTLATVVYRGEEMTEQGNGILQMFVTVLKKNPSCRLIAHNGKNFDYPFLTRRMMLCGLPIPAPLNAHNKKPWEMLNLVDTVEMWASTEYKPYISLDLLCELFGIPSPKDGVVTGATVGDFYWADPVGSLGPIGVYCGKDTVALAKLHKILERLLVPAKG